MARGRGAINALLYSPNHAAIDWSGHCELTRGRPDGAGRSKRCSRATRLRRRVVMGLMPAAAAESEDVLSLTLHSPDGQPLPAALPGQYVVLRLQHTSVGVYGPEPLERPAEGNLLVCCSQPSRDVVIDL
jgi:hypothetical protein